MANFHIRKKTTDIWEHNWTNAIDQNLILSSGYFNLVDLIFTLFTKSDGVIRTSELSEIIVFDDTDVSAPETFTTALAFATRMKALDYPYFLTGTTFNLLNQDALGSAPGSINYDPVKGTMNVRNSFVSSSLQVGQEMYIFCKNTTGSTIVEGDVVNISGYDATSDAFLITKALADTIENTEVIGVVTTNMINNATGLVTTFGRVNDLDTSSFSEGDTVYLSSSTSGDFTATKPASIPIQVGYIGKVNATTGFIQVDIRSLPPSIRGTFSHDADQTYTLNVSKAINFNTNDILEGITHSTSVDNEEITFDSGGIYQISVEPQYSRTSGGGTNAINMYVQKSTDGGTNFVNISNSNIKVTVASSSEQAVTSLTQTLKFNQSDIVRIMIQVENANLILDAFVGFGTGANVVPATPSVIMNIHRIGD